MDNNIFKRVLQRSAEHQKFLDSTEKNISFLLFGRLLSLSGGWSFPTYDIINTLQTWKPEAHNALGYLINNFIEEIGNSDFIVEVSPTRAGEPYDSFSDTLENRLDRIHASSQKKLLLKPLALEILIHGFAGVYTNGSHYWPLTGYDFIPGDASIRDVQDQPWNCRRTAVYPGTLLQMKSVTNAFVRSKLERMSPIDHINVYDVWSKPMDRNWLFMEDGTLIYEQRFPHPKSIYPFFLANDANLVNYFYTVPLLSLLVPLQEKYVESLSNIEDSAKSIARPMLVYDTDAGVDDNKLLLALKKGYKQVLLQKLREGQIQFLAPGALPTYAQQLPMYILEELRNTTGISEAFLGNQPGGVREKGAMGKLVTASMRKIVSKARLLEEMFSKLDFYLIEYSRYHSNLLGSEFKTAQDVLEPNVYFIPSERIVGLHSQETLDAQMMALRKWAQKLIGQKQSLRELGYPSPKKVLDEQMSELEEMQKITQKAQENMNTPQPSLLDTVVKRLGVAGIKGYQIEPLGEDKIAIKCNWKDKNRIAFILSDLAEHIFLESADRAPDFKGLRKLFQEKLAEKEQKEQFQPQAEVTPEQPMTETLQNPTAQVPAGAPLQSAQPNQEAAGPTPEQMAALLAASKPSQKSQGNLSNQGVPTVIKKAPVVAHHSPTISALSTDSIKSAVGKLSLKSRTKIRIPDRYTKLQGLYIVEPHAEWIATNKKLLLIKSKIYDIINKPLLLCGKYVYGVIIIRAIVRDFDFKALQALHLVTDKEKTEWWGNQQLYAYLFEFHPFEKFLEYERPQGVQTFIKEVNVHTPLKSTPRIGVPFTGDLKPIDIKPWKIPAPHKPEKKAFSSNEVFSIKRLKELLPDGNYDVSKKVDGLLTFVWKVGKEIKAYSDTGRQFNSGRITPILKSVSKVFPHDVLICGELYMEGIARKDVNGYIHGLWKPKAEELNALRLFVWDILYVKGASIAMKPYSVRSSVLNLYLKGQEGSLIRVPHTVVARDGVPEAIRKVHSAEGAFIRNIDAAYWATHSSFKMKYMYDFDAKVIAVEKTKLTLPIFHCVTREGDYIGQTYAQSSVTAKAGDTIRVNIEHVSIKKDGSFGWYSPRPKSVKEGKIIMGNASPQPGIGGPDGLALVKEIYLASGGSEANWKAWLPSYEKWHKEVNSKLIESLKSKVDKGVEASKT